MLLGSRCSRLKTRRLHTHNSVVMEFQLIQPSRPPKTMATGYVSIDRSQVVLQFLHPMPSIIQAQVPEEILNLVSSLLMIPRKTPGSLGLKPREQTLILNLMLPSATPTTQNMHCSLSDFQPETDQRQVLELTLFRPEEEPWNVVLVLDQCLLTPDLKNSPNAVTSQLQLLSDARLSTKPQSERFKRAKPFLKCLATVLRAALMLDLLTQRNQVWLTLV
ncbi:NS7a protein [Pigeon coronavirus UAE-HKU29]|nr:NS7a protein [Houbara coronavirus UAE-HKU28]BBC54847.1 NS7a protein [Pigeon coronavirus UAE-HKU29]